MKQEEDEESTALINKLESLTNFKKIKDKSDKALTEKVLSKRVVMLLLRFKNNGIINEFHGCVSTGKEANVYHAFGEKGELAVKIYKAEILDYKDRRRYLEGDFRLKNWNVGTNRMRITRKWAEKEMRNLIRLFRENLPSPEPYILRSNILIMKFLGIDGKPFPLLASAPIQENHLFTLFIQGSLILKKLYYSCKLVHGDFSEYNLLVDLSNEQNVKLYVIDVSQAVENLSQRSIYFLKEDCHNFMLFFAKRGLVLPTISVLFQLIINNNINIEEFENNLIEQINLAKTGSLEQFTKDHYFRNTLDEQIFDEISEETSGSSDIIFDVYEGIEPKSKETQEERKKRRKENKRQVKAENKEKRLTKMPKNIKKKLIKKSK